MARYFKTDCSHCGGHLEFPAELFGTDTECPHCHAQTLLSGTEEAPAEEPTEQLSASKPRSHEPRIAKLGIILTSVAVFVLSVIALPRVFRSPEPVALPPSADPNPIDEPAVSAPPTVPRAETSSELMSRAEAEIRRGSLSTVADTLNRIIRDHPQSHEARTVVGLVRLLRQEGLTPYVGSVSSCTLDEVRRLKKMFDSMEGMAKQYHTLPNDAKRAIDTIFGPATFSSPNLSLDGLLNAGRQMEAARLKALQGQ